MASTAAQIRASSKYLKKTYERTTVCLKKEFDATVKNHLTQRNESANSFFNRAAVTQMALDNGTILTAGEVQLAEENDE